MANRPNDDSWAPEGLTLTRRDILRVKALLDRFEPRPDRDVGDVSDRQGDSQRAAPQNWVQITSTTLQGMYYPGIMFQRWPDTGEWVQLPDAIWVFEVNGQALATGRYYRGFCSGTFGDLMVFDVNFVPGATQQPVGNVYLFLTQNDDNGPFVVPGQIVPIAVNISKLFDNVTGQLGLVSAETVIRFDPVVWNVGNLSLALGSLLPAGGSGAWSISSSQPEPGYLVILLTTPTAFVNNIGGPLATFNLTVNAAATAGDTVVNLSADTGNHTPVTYASDQNFTNYVLNPAPQDSFPALTPNVDIGFTVVQ